MIHGFTTVRGDLISNIELESLPLSPQSSSTTKDDDDYNDEKREKAWQITTQLKQLTQKFHLQKFFFKQTNKLKNNPCKIQCKLIKKN